MAVAGVLAGARVLVAEDDFVIALELEALLREFGCEVLGPATMVGEALELLGRERPDAALLDVGLGDGPAWPVAAALAAAGVPFALATGYPAEGLGAAASAAVAVLGKPFGAAEVERVLLGLLSR